MVWEWLGEPLEWLVKMVLAFTLAQTDRSQTWGGAFPYLKDTKAQDVKLESNVKVSALPQFKKDANPKGEEGVLAWEKDPAKIWRSVASPSDWGVILEKEVFAVNSIGQPAPKSYSGDILYNTPEVMLVWACKLGETKIQWAHIGDEIKKTSPLCEHKHVCLVIAAFSLGPQVEDSISNDHRGVLSNGDWYYNNGLLERKERSTRSSNEPALSVPKNMEVILLGKSDMKKFLGEPNFDGLQQFSSSRSLSSLHTALTPNIAIRVPQMNPPAPIEQSGIEFQFLVIFANSGRKPSRWNAQVSSEEDLREQLVKKFNIACDFDVSYYDEQFKEYVEIDISFMQQNRIHTAKLQIELKN